MFNPLFAHQFARYTDNPGVKFATVKNAVTPS
jgi:hypothetical protein